MGYENDMSSWEWNEFVRMTWVREIDMSLWEWNDTTRENDMSEYSVSDSTSHAKSENDMSSWEWVMLYES